MSIPSGTYMLIHATTREIMDLNEGKSDARTPVVIGSGTAPCSTTRWLIYEAGTGYHIKNEAGGTFLSIARNLPPIDGTYVTGNPRPAEWFLERRGYVFMLRLAAEPSLVLSVSSGNRSKRKRVILEHDTAAENQTWLFQPAD